MPRRKTQNIKYVEQKKLTREDYLKMYEPVEYSYEELEEEEFNEDLKELRYNYPHVKYIMFGDQITILTQYSNQPIGTPYIKTDYKFSSKNDNAIFTNI